MKKRQFLGTAVAGGLASALPAGAASPAATGPALLTVTGAIGKPNRGKFDPVRDQMMFKQKLGFDKAHAFTFAALAALPAVTIKPTLEYDAKTHTLSGPLLLDVVKAAGGALGDNVKLVLRAVDGYAASITMAQARAALHRRHPHGRGGDGAGRTRSAMGDLRCRQGARDDRQTAAGAVWFLPVGLVSHRGGGVTPGGRL